MSDLNTVEGSNPLKLQLDGWGSTQTTAESMTRTLELYGQYPLRELREILSREFTGELPQNLVGCDTVFGCLVVINEHLHYNFQNDPIIVKFDLCWCGTPAAFKQQSDMESAPWTDGNGVGWSFVCYSHLGESCADYHPIAQPVAAVLAVRERITFTFDSRDQDDTTEERTFQKGQPFQQFLNELINDRWSISTVKADIFNPWTDTDDTIFIKIDGQTF